MITKFTVDWNTWRCGQDSSHKHGEGITKLLNTEGFRCCLGFVENQLGLTDDQILNELYPDSTHIENILCVKRDIEYFNTALANKCAAINDDRWITNAERIYRLQQEFKNEGLELSFINVPEEIQKEVEAMQ